MDNGLKVGGVNVNERGLVILSFLLFLTQIRLKKQAYTKERNLSTPRVTKSPQIPHKSPSTPNKYPQGA
jgi:hypothetical protein